MEFDFNSDPNQYWSSDNFLTSGGGYNPAAYAGNFNNGMDYGMDYGNSPNYQQPDYSTSIDVTGYRGADPTNVDTNPTQLNYDVGGNNFYGNDSYWNNAGLPNIGGSDSSGSGSNWWDSLNNMFGGNQGLGGMYAPMMIGQAMKQWNDAGKYAQGAETAANRSDPFGQYRQGYGDRLQSLYNDPSQVENTPGYKFALQQGLGAVDRSNAARGYLGSGKAATDAMDYASGLASKTWNDEVNRLGQFAGAQFNPASAGQMLMQGQANQIGSQNAALASLGSIFGAMQGSGQTQNRPGIVINNTNSGGNNTANAQGGGGGSGGYGGGSSGAYGNSTPYGGGTPTRMGVDPRQFYGTGALGRLGADQLGNPDVQAWLQANGIDPNSLPDSGLNILSGSGTWDPNGLTSGGGYFGGGMYDGLDPSTANILGDGNYGIDWQNMPVDYFGGGTDFSNLGDPGMYDFGYGGY